MIVKGFWFSQHIILSPFDPIAATGRPGLGLLGLPTTKFERKYHIQTIISIALFKLLFDFPLLLLTFTVSHGVTYFPG